MAAAKNEHFLREILGAIIKHYTTQISWRNLVSAINDTKLSSLLVESVVATHFRRHYPTYYIKADNEVDVAYVDNNKFWPIEIKWTNQIRPQDLKQILKYQNGEIWAKIRDKKQLGNTFIIPLPLALLAL